MRLFVKVIGWEGQGRGAQHRAGEEQSVITTDETIRKTAQSHSLLADDGRQRGGETVQDGPASTNAPQGAVAHAEGLRRLHQLTERLSGLRSVPGTADAVAEGARSLGFEVAVINLARADGALQTIQVAGNEAAREALLDNVASRAEWDGILAVGRHYLGAIWQDHRELTVDESVPGWIPDGDAGADDGWHPLDALFVPMHASDGSLLGTLSVDLPTDGHRPADHVLELLGMFGRQAAQALENARLHDSLVARERELAAALARTEALLAAAPVAIIELDVHAKVTRWNLAAERMLGWRQDEVLGGSNPASLDLADGVIPGDVIDGGNLDRVQLRRLTKSGEPIEVELSTAVIHDADGVPAGVIGAMTDITQRLLQERLLRTAAFRDPLTGLANRARMMETLAERLADDVPTALLLADLDGFKKINDGYGHGVGDEVLVEMARRFDALDDTVLVARLGGDEFVVLCADAHQAERIAAAVVREGCHPVSTTAGAVRLGVSVGLAADAAEAERAPTRILRHADVALYAAKAAGRGCWRAWTLELEAQAFAPGRQALTDRRLAPG